MHSATVKFSIETVKKEALLLGELKQKTERHKLSLARGMSAKSPTAAVFADKARAYD